MLTQRVCTMTDSTAHLGVAAVLAT